MEPNKFQRYNDFAKRSIYSELEEGNFHNGLIEHVTNRYLKNLNKDVKILDVGCGPGVFMDFAKKLGFTNIAGVTLGEEDVQKCREKGHIVIEADISDVPLDNESQDLIWSRHSLEHSPYPLFTLLEYNRLLKMNGLLYVEVPAPDIDRNHEWTPNHFSILGSNMWRSLFRQTGFDLEIHEVLELPLVDQSHKQYHEKFFTYVLRKRKEEGQD